MAEDNSVSIIMYHYVRDLPRTRYPEIKGLLTEKFRQQVEYFEKNYTFISAQDLMDAVSGRTSLPRKSVLLTFDDGYTDHFTDVFPILAQKKIPACFFPPAQTYLENRILDVNMIHFVLASSSDHAKLGRRMEQVVLERAGGEGIGQKLLERNQTEYLKPGRFDPAETNYVKRTLQKGLPKELRQGIIDDLFREFVTQDFESFHHELYLSRDQILCMHEAGMYFGNHGDTHCWLDHIDRDEQVHEIRRSQKFLEDLGVYRASTPWIMCYPHGGYNESLIEVLKENHCVAGLTIHRGVARLNVHSAFELPRFDTNDILLEE